MSMNLRNKIQYKGICRNIMENMNFYIMDNHFHEPLQLLQKIELENTKVQEIEKTGIVPQKIQLHFSYDNNTKTLEICYDKHDIKKLSSQEDYNNNNVSNGIEIIIQIKKIIS